MEMSNRSSHGTHDGRPSGEDIDLVNSPAPTYPPASASSKLDPSSATTSQSSSSPEPPILTIHPACLIFQRPTAAYRYSTSTRRNIKNNMLVGIGLLELANACDFAANIWNQVPVPIYAKVLMGLGGALALYISWYAIHDATLSFNNVQLLKQERWYVQRRNISLGVRQGQQVLDRHLQCRLDVNFRETGTELADRFGMDLLMGVAALLVSIGTLMAIEGHDHSIYRASNLLSGYLGNGISAFWGLMNVAWCIFVWKRIMRHSAAVTEEFQDLHDEDAEEIKVLFRKRHQIVAWHAVFYGITGFVAGVGALLTTTQWWGYVILLPCIAAAVVSNHIFRHYILYTRPSIQELALVTKATLLAQLKGILAIRRLLRGQASHAVTHLLAGAVTLPSLLAFIADFGLFEDFCHRIVMDHSLVEALFKSQGGGDGESQSESQGEGESPRQIHTTSATQRQAPQQEQTSTVFVFDPDRLAATEGPYADKLRDLAEACVKDVAAQCTVDRERFLLETFGCMLTLERRDREDEAIIRTGAQRRRPLAGGDMV
ncbi:integral membrane protein [Phlyctema vagabunda]|uniref:Integral membrane protein n=1 Tax=Phlyctema vagabunda TaxID=108571 RepID=A0ABR4P241_9HELO